MSQLYTSQSTVDKLLTIFSSLFLAATRPTRHLLAWLLIAQLALESASSVRCLFRQFLSKQTDASLNSYYRALGDGLVTDASIRQALALRALAIVPEALRQEPILLSVDDNVHCQVGQALRRCRDPVRPRQTRWQVLFQWTCICQLDDERAGPP